MDHPANVATGRGLFRGRPMRWIGAIIGTCLLALCLFSPARLILNPDLDPSNHGTYAWFTAHECQYGTEVIPMVGPFGFVAYGYLYAGHLFAERLLLELAIKLALATTLIWFFLRAGPGWLRWVWLGSVVLIAPAITDIPYDLASLFAGLALLAVTGRRRRIDILLAALLALLSLLKGTQTQMALLALGLACAQAVLQRDLRRSIWLLGSYGLTLVILLFVAGQNPLNFPAYLGGILELSSGYNQAMGLDEGLTVFLTGVTTLVALLLLVGGSAAVVWRDQVRFPGLVLLAAFSFIKWKHGFVRADGHVFYFFDYVCIAAPTVWLWAFRPAEQIRRAWLIRLCVASAWTAVLLSHWATGPESLRRHQWLMLQFPGNLTASCRQLYAPAAAKAELSTRLNQNRAWHDLPLVRTRVGDASIDFFGSNQGYLLLNRLNYQPRPMGGGSFNVYTPWLLDRNLAAMADPARRPAYFLTKATTIDDRVLTQDDSGTLRALLAFYRPVDIEQDLVLFEQHGGTDLPTPRLLAQQSLTWEQPVVPPAVGADEMLAVEMDLPLNLLGHARTFLYKPPMTYLDFEGEGIEHPRKRRIIPAMFRRPVLLNPVIEDTADLVALYTKAEGKRLRHFRIHTESPGLFTTAAMKVRFYAVPRPPFAATAEPIIERFAFKASDWVPSEKDAPGSHLRRVGGMNVRVLDAPARIHFPIEDDAHTVRLIYGVDPEAYIRGHTDGVEFLVDLERPGQPAQPLFSQLLKPATRPEDRPFQVAKIVLPPHPPGSALSLRTEIGPDKNGAWDWGFFAGVGCKTGDYIPEQFPGFGRLPSTVAAGNCGAFVHEGRPLFLLNPPGRMTFLLTGTETALEFRAGLLPGAYTNGGNSDGIGLRIEIEEAGGGTSIIHSQILNPRDREEDRGSRRIHVPLPASAPGARLNLTIDPGPANNDSWDWSYLESLRFQ